MKQRKRPREPSRLKPLLQVLGFWLLLVGTILIFALIVLSAGRLGWLFLPALVLYLAVLVGAGYLLLRRHEKLEEHGLMGDELYYATYPVDRWFHERKLALQAWLAKIRAK